MPFSLHLVMGRYEVAIAAGANEPEPPRIPSVVADTDRLVFGFGSEGDELDED